MTWHPVQVLVAGANTTIWLLKFQQNWWTCEFLPHMTALMMIGIIFFMAVRYCWEQVSHLNWNHSVPDDVSHPQVQATLVTMVKVLP